MKLPHIDQSSQIQLVQNIQQQVLLGLSLDRVMDEICLDVEQTLRGFHCAIFVTSDCSEQLELLSAPTLPVDLRMKLSTLPIAPDACPISRAAATGQIAVFPDLIPMPYDDQLIQIGLVGVHSVPVKNDEGRCEAVFSIFSYSERCLSPSQVNFVESLSLSMRMAMHYTKSQINLSRERKAAEAKSKLATLGELTSGIAHEINNPLFAIQGASDLLTMICSDANPDIEEIRSLCAQIDGNVGRISRTIRSLKAYSRNSAFDPETPVSVGSIIDDVRELSFRKAARAELGENLVFLLEKNIADLTINCRPGEIVQVLLNLVNNSIDAIQSSKSPWIRIEVLYRVDAIKIVVTDSGMGLPKDIQERIFESFFTTKPLEQGTGLGLSISKKLISAHGGELYYNPRSPNTQFIVELPLKIESSI